MTTRATTLEQVVGCPVSREALLIALLRRLDTLYHQTPDGPGGRAAGAARGVARAARDAGHTGRDSPGRERELIGQADDVNEDGALLVRDAGRYAACGHLGQRPFGGLAGDPRRRTWCRTIVERHGGQVSTTLQLRQQQQSWPAHTP